VNVGHRPERSNPATGLWLDKNNTSGKEDWFDSDGTTDGTDSNTARANSSSNSATGATTENSTAGGEEDGQLFDAVTEPVKRFIAVIMTALRGEAGSDADYYEAIVAWMVLTFGLMTLALVVVGIVVNPVILALAGIFALTSGLMYYHLSGQMAADVYRRVEQQATAHGQPGAGGSSNPAEDDELNISEQDAYEALGVPADADQETIKEAYRQQIKEAHPDTDGGSEEEFKRIKDAYELLQE
jgi:hypothetical protein